MTKFNVYREDIFNCCMRTINRKSFNPFNKVSVKFSDIGGNSEGAVDVGGPTREMFRLVLNHVKDSRLFFGISKKYVRFDMDALQKRDYFAVGVMIAMSLIHGAQGPHFFSESLYSILCNENSKDLLSIHDVEDNIREKLLHMKNIEDLISLQEYITDEPVFEIAGIHFVKQMEEKDKLLEEMIQFYAYHRVRPALEQLKEGLSTGDILRIMRKHDSFRDIMCRSVTITSDVLEKLFSIDYSEVGSSHRIEENRAVTFWRDLLIDCEENNVNITLEDILVFATGADTIPPGGFENVPSLTFSHDTNLYPKANTCALQLEIPTIHKTYDNFKQHISFGIGNCKDFAFA